MIWGNRVFESSSRKTGGAASLRCSWPWRGQHHQSLRSWLNMVLLGYLSSGSGATFGLCKGGLPRQKRWGGGRPCAGQATPSGSRFCGAPTSSPCRQFMVMYRDLQRSKCTRSEPLPKQLLRRLVFVIVASCHLRSQLTLKVTVLTPST